MAKKRTGPDVGIVETGKAQVPSGTASTDTKAHLASQATSGTTLRLHFDRALGLLEGKAALATAVAEWRNLARGAGLDPRALLKLAGKHLRDAEQRRKAAEQAEVEELYRRGLGLPLFAGRA